MCTHLLWASNTTGPSWEWKSGASFRTFYAWYESPQEGESFSSALLTCLLDELGRRGLKHLCWFVLKSSQWVPARKSDSSMPASQPKWNIAVKKKTNKKNCCAANYKVCCKLRATSEMFLWLFIAKNALCPHMVKFPLGKSTNSYVWTAFFQPQVVLNVQQCGVDAWWQTVTSVQKNATRCFFPMNFPQDRCADLPWPHCRRTYFLLRITFAC